MRATPLETWPLATISATSLEGGGAHLRNGAELVFREHLPGGVVRRVQDQHARLVVGVRVQGLGVGVEAAGFGTWG